MDDRLDILEGRLETAGPSPSPFHPAVRMELGQWSKGLIEEYQARAYSEYAECGDRVCFWARALLGTRTHPESALPELERHEVRVRLETLDCVTFVYSCLALARSRTFEEFVTELVHLRYANADERGVDNDPDYGNFLDFACESLLREAVGRGILDDVTPTLVRDATAVVNVSTLLTSHARAARFDPKGGRVRPVFGDWQIEKQFLNRDGLQAAMDKIRPGDIIMATRGSSMPTLVHHCLIAELAPDSQSYIHASFNGYWFSEETHRQLQDEPERFPEMQCGVSRGSIYAGEEFTVAGSEERSYHAYLRAQLRPIADALDEPFVGALILRPN